MSSRAVRSVVEHPVRLDLLDRLDRQPQTVARMSRRIGREERAVEYHLRQLEAFGLAAKAGDDEGDGRPLYAANLRDHPVWVARAVNVRRRARTVATGTGG